MLHTETLFLDWYNNPKHWFNNKRKIHGLCTLRKSLNDKNRFLPPRYTIYINVEQDIRELLPKTIENMINSFTCNDCNSISME